MRTLESYISSKVIPFLTGDSYAPSVFITHVSFLNWRQMKKNVMRSAVQLKGTCIDVGCGNAPYREWIKKYVKMYIMTDWGISRKAMFAAAENSYIDAEATALPFADQCADSVVLTQVLEHTKDPRGVLKEVGRLLKPGGILMVSVPFIYPVHGAPYDYYRYSEYGLTHLLELNGFRVKEIHYQGYFGTCVVSIFNGYLWSLASLNKSLRNFLLLPILLSLFCITNMVGLAFDLIKIAEFSPNMMALAIKVND